MRPPPGRPAGAEATQGSINNPTANPPARVVNTAPATSAIRDGTSGQGAQTPCATNPGTHSASATSVARCAA